MTNQPHPIVSLLPIAVLILLLTLIIPIFGSDALAGGSQIALLTTSAFCVFLGILIYKKRWIDFEKAIVNNISDICLSPLYHHLL